MAYITKDRNNHSLVEKRQGKKFYLMPLGKDPLEFLKDDKIAEVEKT